MPPAFLAGFFFCGGCAAFSGLSATVSDAAAAAAAAGAALWEGPLCDGALCEGALPCSGAAALSVRTAKPAGSWCCRLADGALPVPHDI